MTKLDIHTLPQLEALKEIHQSTTNKRYAVSYSLPNNGVKVTFFNDDKTLHSKIYSKCANTAYKLIKSFLNDGMGANERKLYLATTKQQEESQP